MYTSQYRRQPYAWPSERYCAVHRRERILVYANVELVLPPLQPSWGPGFPSNARLSSQVGS